MIEKNSYTSANSLPVKIFSHKELLESIDSGKGIIPIHLQVNPTNKCPLNCSFCSCANRDKSAEIGYNELMRATEKFIKLGIKAVTITGGGDPLAYEKLPDYIEYLYAAGIDSSLVTNGVLFKTFDDLSFLEKLTWARISLSDNRQLRKEEIGNAIAHDTDWSFSYVVSKVQPDIVNIINSIRFANEHNFTHVRIVDDIIGGRESALQHIKEMLIESGEDVSRVIWQGRKTYNLGREQCLISLLKPNLTPDGMIVGCCGVQYSSNPPMLDWPRMYSLGTIDDIEKIYSEQKFFDGRKCVRCYYDNYNAILSGLVDVPEMKHENFV